MLSAKDFAVFVIKDDRESASSADKSRVGKGSGEEGENGSVVVIA